MTSERFFKENYQYILIPLDSWNSELPHESQMERFQIKSLENLTEFSDKNESYSPILFWKKHFFVIALYAWCTLFLVIFIIRLFLPLKLMPIKKSNPKPSLNYQHVALEEFLKSSKDKNAQKAFFNAVTNPSAGLACIKSLFPTDFVVDPNNEADLRRVLNSDCPQCNAIPLQVEIDKSEE